MLFQLHRVVYLIRKRSDNYLVLINWLTNCVVYLDHLFLCWFCQRLQRLVQANRGKKHIINNLIKYLINVGTRLDILKLLTLILAKGKGDKINRDNSQSGTCWNFCLFNSFWIPTMTITEVTEFVKKWICGKTKVHIILW